MAALSRCLPTLRNHATSWPAEGTTGGRVSREIRGFIDKKEEGAPGGSIPFSSAHLDKSVDLRSTHTTPPICQVNARAGNSRVRHVLGLRPASARCNCRSVPRRLSGLRATGRLAFPALANPLGCNPQQSSLAGARALHLPRGNIRCRKQKGIRSTMSRDCYTCPANCPFKRLEGMSATHEPLDEDLRRTRLQLPKKYHQGMARNRRKLIRQVSRPDTAEHRKKNTGTN